MLVDIVLTTAYACSMRPNPASVSSEIKRILFKLSAMLSCMYEPCLKEIYEDVHPDTSEKVYEEGKDKFVDCVDCVVGLCARYMCCIFVVKGLTCFEE